MKWHRKFKIALPQDFYDVCNKYIRNNPPEPYFRYMSVEDSDMWTMWMDDPQAGYVSGVRETILYITGLDLDYEQGFVVLWKFDEEFKHCPIHVDSGKGTGGKHNGSICTALSGNFKIHLHADDLEETILDTVEVDSNTIIALNNTQFPHSVEGEGVLIVFGVDLETDPEVYWHD